MINSTSNYHQIDLLILKDTINLRKPEKCLFYVVSDGLICQIYVGHATRNLEYKLACSISMQNKADFLV